MTEPVLGVDEFDCDEFSVWDDLLVNDWYEYDDCLEEYSQLASEICIEESFD